MCRCWRFLLPGIMPKLSMPLNWWFMRNNFRSMFPWVWTITALGGSDCTSAIQFQRAMRCKKMHIIPFIKFPAIEGHHHTSLLYFAISAWYCFQCTILHLALTCLILQHRTLKGSTSVPLLNMHCLSTHRNLLDLHHGHYHTVHGFDSACSQPALHFGASSAPLLTSPCGSLLLTTLLQIWRCQRAEKRRRFPWWSQSGSRECSSESRQEETQVSIFQQSKYCCWWEHGWTSAYYRPKWLHQHGDWVRPAGKSNDGQ